MHGRVSKDVSTLQFAASNDVPVSVRSCMSYSFFFFFARPLFCFLFDSVDVGLNIH